MKTLRALGLLALFSILAFYPHTSRAHGETLIQIGALTQQIESGTTNNESLYLRRGELFREHKDWERAKADYEKALELGINPADVNLNRGRLLLDKGDLKSAVAIFDSVINSAPKLGDAYIERGRSWLKLENRDKAIADLQQGLSLLDTPQPEHFKELAQALASAGELEQALTTLDQGIKKFGPLPLLQSDAIDIELRLSRWKAAVARIDEVLKIVDRKERWFAQKGEVLLKDNRPNEAKKALMSALKAIDALPPVLKNSPATKDLQIRIRDNLTTAEAQKSKRTIAEGPN